MKNVDEWDALANLLGNLIAKYADVLDLDSLPDPNITSKDTKTNEIKNKNFSESVAKSDAA